MSDTNGNRDSITYLPPSLVNRFPDRTPRWRRLSWRCVSDRSEPYTHSWDPLPRPSPALVALRDLGQVAESPGAAAVILARYAALRCLVQAMEGITVGDDLQEEKSIAADYILPSLPFLPGEMAALLDILEMTNPVPTPDLVRAVLLAGEASESWGHHSGGLACYQIAREITREFGWAEEGRAADEGVARCMARGLGPTTNEPGPGRGDGAPS